jgi:chemotaxis protein methyltransferase WspC
VGADEAELQELVEAVVVPETWFFRDVEALRAMTRAVCEAWLPSHPAGALRVLSMPCSTGEEPYSLAMALLDAGIAEQRFGIDALDISERALARARTGVYRSNSFRGAELSYRDRHFQRVGDGYLLSRRVRDRVHFQKGNLLGENLLASAAVYDIVFCRNVLIYFEPEAQQHVLRRLTRLLAPQGLLFVGPSETRLFLSGPFVSAGVPFAFAFRKAASDVQKRREDIVSTRASGNARLDLPPWPAAAANVVSPPAQELRACAPASLEQALQYANQGKLREAENMCRAHLRAHGPSAQGFHLLGLLSEAAGKAEAAIEHHRKALYLEPDHEETLLHLALLLQTRGELAAAEHLRKRASRIVRARAPASFDPTRSGGAK